MRKSFMSASAIMGIAFLACSSADAKGSKATYIPIAFPSGAVAMLAFGISDDGKVIVGDYTDSSGVEHGFYGPPDGSDYTFFDLPNVTGTEPRGLRPDGSITGIALEDGFTFGKEFYRSPVGEIKFLKNADKKVMDGIVQAGNDEGMYVGDYLDTDGVTRIGFEGKGGKFVSVITLPRVKGVTATSPRQINNNGVIAGGYVDSAGVEHGFLLKGKKLKSFDAPHAVGVTTAEGINDAGQAPGFYTDSAGNRHSFLYDSSTGKFTTIDPGNGSTSQEVWGINSTGLVVGATDNGAFAFIYCPLNKSKCPKGASAAMAHPVNAQAVKRPVHPS